MQAKCSRGAVCWGVYETPNPPALGRSAPVAVLDADTAACSLSPSVATPSPAVHGFRKSPAQPSSASGSAYVPARSLRPLSPCPNEKVAKEIARWGLQCEARKGAYEGRDGERLRCFLPVSGLPVQKSGSLGPSKRCSLHLQGYGGGAS